ncbi:hypothetical protein QUB43_24630, partial [Microcoleus sp. A6-D4]|uniref:hypothetical protein n=1 Tax=Microcoleus sp. A6-D4 TaxID=2818552 RepID=UPI002FD7C8FC
LTDRIPDYPSLITDYHQFCRHRAEGSSATDCVADLTDLTDRIPDYPSLITDYHQFCRHRAEGRNKEVRQRIV